MKTLRPIYLSSYPPEQCGLATFTKDSADSVDAAAGRPISSVMAIKKTCSLAQANGRVAHLIDNNQRGAYRQAASVVNGGQDEYRTRRKGTCRSRCELAVN